MRTMALVAGAGLLVGAAAIGVAATMRDGGDIPRTTPSDGAAKGQPTGVRWDPDALLPSVEAGGARQAQWAAEAIRNLDASADGRLQAFDAETAAAGGWGTGGPTHVINALIARYDTSGDGILDAGEATLVGADVAKDGWLSAATVDALRRELGA
jgi:hypothetical protein